MSFEIEKKKNFFLPQSALSFLKDVDIEKVLVSNKISFGEKNFKYFIGYLYNDNKVNPIHTMISKTKAYVKSYYGKTKWMYFFD